MDQIFVLNIRDELRLEEFFKEYTSCAAFDYVQRAVVAINWSSRGLRDKSNGASVVMQQLSSRLATIVDQICIEEKFRLLVIGESGHVKTTILSKVRALPLLTEPSDTCRYVERMW